MDINKKLAKVNPLVKEMSLSLYYKLKGEFDIEACIMACNYRMATITSNMRAKFEIVPDLYTPAPLNLSVFLFLPSGKGKTESFRHLDQWYFKDAYMALEKNYRGKARVANIKLEDDETLEANEKWCRIWIQEVGDPTEPFLYDIAESYYKVGFGSVCVFLDEISRTFESKADLFTILMDPLDNGNFKPRGLKTERTHKAMEDTPPNLVAFSVAGNLIGSGTVAKHFNKLLTGGYGRRSLFYKAPDDFAKDEKKSKLTKAKNEEFNRLALGHKDKAKEISDSIFNMIVGSNANITLTWEDGVFEKFEEFELECTNRDITNDTREESLIVHYKGVPFQVGKLAGIYAWFEGKKKVSEEHLKQAIYVSSFSTASYEDIISPMSATDICYNYIANSKGPISKMELLNHRAIKPDWFDKHNKFEESILDILEGEAYHRGDFYREFETGNMRYLEINKYEQSSPNKIILSYGEHDKNFIPQTVNWEELDQWVSEYEICHHQFKKGADGNHNRTKSNTIAKANMIMLDFDEGEANAGLEDIIDEVKGYNYDCWIQPSRNHQKVKDGKPAADRFHLFLRSNILMKFNESEWRGFMINIAKKFNAKVDSQCKDVTRLFYPSEHECIRVQGGPVDVRDFLPNSSQEKDRRKYEKLLITGDVKEFIAMKQRYILMRDSAGELARNAIYYGIVKDMLKAVDAEGNRVFNNDEIKSTVLEIDDNIMVDTSKGSLGEDELHQTVFKALNR